MSWSFRLFYVKCTLGKEIGADRLNERTTCVLKKNFQDDRNKINDVIRVKYLNLNIIYEN